MSEEIEATTTEQTATKEVDTADHWKAEARKWEQRAQDNLAELEELKAANMSEKDKAIARAEKAERELAEVRQTAQRASDASEIVTTYNVPMWLVADLPDRDAMERVAKKYTEDNKTPRAPKASIEPQSGAKLSIQEQFAEFAAAKLK